VYLIPEGVRGLTLTLDPDGRERGGGEGDDEGPGGDIFISIYLSIYNYIS